MHIPKAKAIAYTARDGVRNAWMPFVPQAIIAKTASANAKALNSRLAVRVFTRNTTRALRSAASSTLRTACSIRAAARVVAYASNQSASFASGPSRSARRNTLACSSSSSESKNASRAPAALSAPSSNFFQTRAERPRYVLCPHKFVRARNSQSRLLFGTPRPVAAINCEYQMVPRPPRSERGDRSDSQDRVHYIHALQRRRACAIRDRIGVGHDVHNHASTLAPRLRRVSLPLASAYRSGGRAR